MFISLKNLIVRNTSEYLTPQKENCYKKIKKKVEICKIILVIKAITQKMVSKFLQENHQIILFDGVCNFCNSSVLRIIKHDKKNVFLFTSLQSEIGKQITAHFDIDTSKVDSIVLVTSEKEFFVKSTAALKILQQFGGFWKLLQVGWVFPLFLRDRIYSYIAKNRYKWFGKKESCMIPSPEIQSKFI